MRARWRLLLTVILVGGVGAALASRTHSAGDGRKPLPPLVPRFTETVPSLERPRLVLQADGHRVLGWIAGSRP